MHARSRAATSLAPTRSHRAVGLRRRRPRCAGLGGFVAAAASDLQPVRQRGGWLVSHRTVRTAHRLAATSVVRGQHRAGASARQGRHAGCSAATCRPAFRCSNVWAQSRRNTFASSPGRYASTACPAAALPADRLGRPLPSLQLCRRLEAGELFLLSVTNPASFDSRYFAGQRIRRDRRCASGLDGDTPMMAVDSLHAAVPLVVPSGVSACCSSACRRACSARAFAPRFAPPSAQPSDVQASCLERARPAAPGLSICAFAGGLAAGAAEPPGRRCPERERGAKAEGKTKDAAPGRVESQSAHGGGAARRLRRRAAWGAKVAPMQACPRASHDGTRQSLQVERL